MIKTATLDLWALLLSILYLLKSSYILGTTKLPWKKWNFLNNLELYTFCFGVWNTSQFFHLCVYKMFFLSSMATLVVKCQHLLLDHQNIIAQCINNILLKLTKFRCSGQEEIFVGFHIKDTSEKIKHFVGTLMWSSKRFLDSSENISLPYFTEV